MLNLDPTRERTYRVVKPIPDPMRPGKTLAYPGQEVVVRIADPHYPITILRVLSVDLAAALPDDALTLLSDRPFSDDPIAVEPAPTAAEPTLQLLPRARAG